MTRAKIDGVWQTAEPISILVVNRPPMAGWRLVPMQAAAAGKPDPIPDPMAPNPMARPAENTAHTETKLVDEKLEKSRIMAITKAKMEADSAMACPTSMDLNISPVLAGLREMARLASAAVYPSPMAAPMAPFIWKLVFCK